MIYLDNGATTNHKPWGVKKAVLKSVFKKFCSNPHRGGYNLSNFLAVKIYNIRESLANFFGIKNAENCIFTSGCTEALNLAILSTAKIGGHVITTCYEHNSVLRPLFKLEKEGKISLTILYPNSQGEITIKSITEAIKPNTYMIISTFTSNVTGYTLNILEIGKICKEKSLLFLVDCAQSGGHEKIDMKKLNIDYVSIAGHKGFYASTGIGALICSDNGKKFLNPIKFGGTGTQSDKPIQPTDFPDGFESGTPNTTGILSLGEGLNFVEKNLDKINTKIYNLTKYLVEELKKIPQIIIYPSNNLKSGVVAFNIKKVASNDVGNFLNDHNICVRCGLHCAPLVHKNFNTLNLGMIRVSLSYFNKKREINKLISFLKAFIN